MFCITVDVLCIIVDVFCTLYHSRYTLYHRPCTLYHCRWALISTWYCTRYTIGNLVLEVVWWSRPVYYAVWLTGDPRNEQGSPIIALLRSHPTYSRPVYYAGWQIRNLRDKRGPPVITDCFALIQRPSIDKNMRLALRKCHEFLKTMWCIETRLLCRVINKRFSRWARLTNYSRLFRTHSTLEHR